MAAGAGLPVNFCIQGLDRSEIEEECAGLKPNGVLDDLGTGSGLGP